LNIPLIAISNVEIGRRTEHTINAIRCRYAERDSAQLITNVIERRPHNTRDATSPNTVTRCSLFSTLLSTDLLSDMADLKMLSFTLLAAAALPVVAAQLPAGVIAVPLTRDSGLTAYYAEFQVGTPPQKTYLKIDTGSPNFSFLDPRNPVCATQDCKTFGTFDNTTSSYVLTYAVAI
jgi:hypothetical protein